MAVSRRGIIQSSLASVAAILSGCTGSDGEESSPTSAATVVNVGPGGDFVFTPGTENPLTVSPGTTVKWVWKSDTHNIVVGSQPDDADWQGTPGGNSETYDSGYTYSHTFTVPGTYHYWCQPHKSVGMVADLIVEE